MGVGLFRVDSNGFFERFDRLPDGAKTVNTFVSARPLAHGLSIDRISLRTLAINADGMIRGGTRIIRPFLAFLGLSRMPDRSPLSLGQADPQIGAVWFRSNRFLSIDGSPFCLTQASPVLPGGLGLLIKR